MGSDDRLRRRRQVCANTVQERLNRCVLDSRAEEDGGELERNGRATNGLRELRRGGILFHDEHVTDLFVHFGELFDQFLSFLLREVENFGRNIVGLDDCLTGDNLLSVLVENVTTRVLTPSRLHCR